MRPPEAQRRSAAARARPKTPSIDSERRAAIAKSQVVSRTLVAGAYFEVPSLPTWIQQCCQTDELAMLIQLRCDSAGNEDYLGAVSVVREER